MAELLSCAGLVHAKGLCGHSAMIRRPTWNFFLPRDRAPRDSMGGCLSDPHVRVNLVSNS